LHLRAPCFIEDVNDDSNHNGDSNNSSVFDDASRINTLQIKTQARAQTQWTVTQQSTPGLTRSA